MCRMWADEAIGGWELSGLPIWHTGTPYMANSMAFLMSYSNEDPAILVGRLSCNQEIPCHRVGRHGIHLQES